MKNFFFNFPIQDFDQIKNLQQLRERLLNRLLLSAFIFGTVLLVVATIPAIQRGLYELPVIYVMIYIWLIVVTFVRRLPFNVQDGSWVSMRIASWLFFFFAFGVINLYLSGFNADAGLFFLTFVAMSALLFDLRRGLLAFGLSLAFILLFGYLTVTGRFELQMESPQPANPLLWIIGGGVFLLTSMALIIALTALVHGLVANLTKAQTEAQKLEVANQTLRASEERYRSLVEISPDLIILIGLDGKVILTNSPGIALFGYDRNDVLGNDFMEFILPEDRVLAAESFQQTLRDGITKDVVIRAQRKNGSMFFAEFSAALILDGMGQPQAVMSVGRDISARKQAEQVLQEAQNELENKVRERTAELVSTSEHLRESEETSRVILNATTASLVLLDSAATVLAANNITAERLGKHLEDILGKPIHQFFPEEIARFRKTQFEKVFQTGEEVHFEDFRQGYWFENHMFPILNPNGQVARVVVSARDITERKRMEQSLAYARDELEQRVVGRTWELLETQGQLRNLTKQVVLAQEEERRRVSRELHDEAGQALVSMKYGLEVILADLSEAGAPVQQRLVSAIQQLDQTMEQIRHLAHSLRPPLLDIANLDLTLKDYCREFAESTNMQIEYSGASVPDLSEEAGLSFFRFLQEALTNVAKHANATRVNVKLSQGADRLSLSVTDNGIGASDMRTDGHGHMGMRERFMMLNGEVQIQAYERSGFMITASIPNSPKGPEDESAT